MYSPETINAIHRRLQQALPHNLVLFGGSYLYGEATEESDLDFYVICNWRDILFFRYYRKIIEKIKDEHFTVKWSAVIVPRALYERGWYYIYGRDIQGRIHQSAIYNKLIVRNSFKLAFFHYLVYRIAKDAKEQQIRLIKCAQQFAAAILFIEKIYSFKPYFSTVNLVHQVAENKIINPKPLIELLEAKLSNRELEPERVAVLGDQMRVLLFQMKTQLQSVYDQFVLPNYIIYNARFLFKKNPLFLFTNPDKMVLRKMVKGVERGEHLPELAVEMKRIVFPVIVI